MASWSLLVSLDLNPLARKTLLQGAVWEPKKREWFLSQAHNLANSSAERMLVHRYTEDGHYRDTMGVEYSHGWPFGVRHLVTGTQVWFGQDFVSRSGEITGRQIVRLRYRPGKVFPARSRHYKPAPVSAIGWPRPMIDAVGGFVTLRSINRQGLETYVRYRIRDVVRGRPIPQGMVVANEGRVFQGSATYDGHLYRLYGKTSHYGERRTPSIIVKNRWTDGHEVARVSLTGMGLLQGETYTHEPEGLCVRNGQLIAGVRVGGDLDRRTFRLGVITL